MPDSVLSPRPRCRLCAWVVQVVVKCLCGLFCSLDHSHNSVARAAFSVFKWHGGLDLRQFRNSVVPRQSPLIGFN